METMTDLTAGCKVYGIFNVYTDRKIEARRLHIIVIDKRKKKAKLIDISVTYRSLG